MLWKLFVAELIPEIKIEDVYYGLQHIGIQKTSGNGYSVARVHLGSTNTIRGQLFQRVCPPNLFIICFCQKPNQRHFQITVLYFAINSDFG